jgi:subtilisin family serine protease
MSRKFLAILITATILVVAYWSWIKTGFEAPDRVREFVDVSLEDGEASRLDSIGHSIEEDEKEYRSIIEEQFVPTGRFEDSRVVDKIVESTGSEEGKIVAYFLVESGAARKRLALVEQIYEKELGGELSLVNQYASVGDEVIFDANPLSVDKVALEEYLELADGFISRKSRLSSFVQIKLRTPSVSGYRDLLSGLRMKFPNTVVSRDDLHFVSAEPAEYLPSLQWHLDQIGAPDAWEFSTGGDDVVVAVIDTGCLTTHPDLVENIFVNTDEIPNNGIDDDSNGFVDDVRGWDFLDDDANPNDETGHGTHVSGIVGARGNNGIGTTGVGWNIKVLPLKVGDNTGLSSSAIAEALRYVSSLKQKGVNVVATNNSYGSSSPNNVARAEIQVHEDIGIVFVAAAGNAGEDIDAEGNSQYPAGFPEANIISVANSTQGDDLSFGSNYGIESVDIAAPGQEVYSTHLDDDYEFLTGTSMASPIVAGSIALLAAHETELSASELRQRVFDTAKPLESLSGKILTGGRLDLLAMLEPDLAGHTISVTGHEPHLIILPDSDFTVVFEIEASDGADVAFEYLGVESDVRIQEISDRTFSIQFSSQGAYRFRFTSEKLGIVRELEKIVVVNPGAIADVTTGLLHSWNFREDGPTLVDGVGSGNAELVGATRVDTPLGRGVDFDGTSSFARFNASFSPIVTLSAFVKSDDLLSSPHPRIINMPDYYLYFSTRGISDVPDGNANTLKFYSNRTGDFGVWNSPPDTVLEGEWMHVLASYDSRETTNTPKLYINGVEQRVRLQRIPVGEQTIEGGEAYLGDREDGTRAWDGQMDEVRVFNRLVDKEEVSLLAARYASAVWDTYSISELPDNGSSDSVSLGLRDASGNAPNADFQWSLVNISGGVSLGDANGSSVEVRNPENLNTSIVLKASSSFGVRYYKYDIVSDPPAVEPGVYTGTTSTGGTLWVEVEEGRRMGNITILDEDAEVFRIREPISIDSFGDFETDPFLSFRITGTIDGEVVGQIENSDITFSGQNIKPSNVVTGFDGFYSGGVIGNDGRSFDLKVLQNGEAYLWQTGAHSELIQGVVSTDGTFDFRASDGVTISGRIDSDNGRVRGEVRVGDQTQGIYLRKENLDPVNRYVNLSTRGLSSSGENVLIGGFVLAGAQPRTVLIRGLGPDLENRGVVNFLQNPRIRIFNGSEVIAENESWSTQPNLEELIEFSNRVQASPLPSESMDAAILLELDPGLYTVFLDSKGGEGDGLFEIFDDPGESEPSLFNVSTRGKVKGLGSPLIAGFVVAGFEPKQVLIRALGPALGDRGISDPLADPWIELYSESVPIAANDDWSEGSRLSSNGSAIRGPARGLISAFESSGATALNFGSKDAAMLVWLEPGLYTAMARGFDGDEGIALVEVFELR